jgi:hypothetical protein
LRQFRSFKPTPSAPLFAGLFDGSHNRLNHQVLPNRSPASLLQLEVAEDLSKTGHHRVTTIGATA